MRHVGWLRTVASCAFIALSGLTSCTTVVHAKVSLDPLEGVSPWLREIGEIHVAPYHGQFFSSGGLVMLDTPRLSESFHDELKGELKRAIQASGGSVGVEGAGDLEIRIDSCLMSWSSGGLGIYAKALVALTASKEYERQSFVVSVHGEEVDSSVGVRLASSAEPQLARALQQCISRLLSERPVLAKAGGPPAGPVVKLPVVGYFESYDEVIVGEVVNDTSKGTSVIHVEALKSGVRGRGSSRITYVPIDGSIIGQRGLASVSFDDGRHFDCDWRIHEAVKGSGTGVDQEGNRVFFTYGMPKDEALRMIESIRRRVAGKPTMPPLYDPKEERRKRGYATGTGFFVTADGFVLTNYHVIEEAASVIIKRGSGEELDAKVIAVDPANDVALLKVEAEAKPLCFAVSKLPRKGAEVFTLGYPRVLVQGNEQKATFGRINAESGLQGDARFLQIDVPIQPGNSGGPLIDTQGNVVGITTMTLNVLKSLRDTGALPQNVNYALKSSYASPLLSPYIAVGERSERVGRKAYEDLIRELEPSVVLIVAK